METKVTGSVPKWLLIGCGAILVVGLSLFAMVGWWILSTPEGGVKIGSEVDAYALQYLESHKLLNPGENVLAYYDSTISMDGTEAAILTNDRVIYHKDGRTSALRLEEVQDVRHRYETLIGDVIEVEDNSGTIVKIEIAPLNQGESFKNALMSAWKRARGEPSGG